MLQPTAGSQRPAPLTARAVGDYRRVRQAVQAPVAPPTPAPVVPTLPAPQPVAPAAPPAAEGGLLSRLFAWL